MQLADDQIDFGRDLKSASAVAVPVRLTKFLSWDWATGPVYAEKTVSVSLIISGSGPLSHDADHGDLCQAGYACHGTRVDSFREGPGVLTVDGATLEGVGVVGHGLAVDAA